MGLGHGDGEEEGYTLVKEEVDGWISSPAAINHQSIDEFIKVIPFVTVSIASVPRDKVIK